MIKKIDHVVITVKDLSTTLQFYQSLGFQVDTHANRYSLYAGDFKINVQLLGKELSPHADKVQPGSSDLCFEITSSLETYKKELENKGLSIHLDQVLRKGVKGDMHSIYLYDPDGNLLEFCSYI